MSRDTRKITELRTRRLYSKEEADLTDASSLRNITRMGNAFPLNADAIFEYFRDGIKDEMHIRHMGQPPAMSSPEWFHEKIELNSNTDIQKLVFQGDLSYPRRAFALAATMPSLKNIAFYFGRREVENYNLSFGIAEMGSIPQNNQVESLEISLEDKNYKNDSPRGQLETQKLMMAVMRYVRFSFKSLNNVKITLPQTQDTISALESFLKDYFPGKIKYETVKEGDLSKIIANCKASAPPPTPRAPYPPPVDILGIQTPPITPSPSNCGFGRTDSLHGQDISTPKIPMKSRERRPSSPYSPISSSSIETLQLHSHLPKPTSGVSKRFPQPGFPLLFPPLSVDIDSLSVDTSVTMNSSDAKDSPQSSPLLIKSQKLGTNPPRPVTPPQDPRQKEERKVPRRLEDLLVQNMFTRERPRPKKARLDAQNQVIPPYMTPTPEEFEEFFGRKK